MNSPILPGAVIGVMGSGQLGRMFAIAARRMGYRVHTFSPDYDTPTGQVSDQEWNSSFEDEEAVTSFAKGVQVVTFEFENIPSKTIEWASQHTLVFPSAQVLYATQHRLREKTFLSKTGFPLVPFHHVTSKEELKKGLALLGTPCVLKSAGFGYDGKGQKTITSLDKAEAAYDSVGDTESVLEKFIDFDCELSVIAARGWDGNITAYGVFKNHHVNHILDVTVLPAPIDSKIQQEAVEIARGILTMMNVVGVMCVEFFLSKDGKLYVNELAPRPHNSGHLTFDACVTSQFEQQLRAVCGLPLGSADLLRPAAMVNLLGDLWQKGEPKWIKALINPQVKLHLYGKAQSRLGRKMGHITALAGDSASAEKLAVEAREALTR
jgi:5-(carboxyamino)imidazole ribonucleotide synthase